MDNKLGAIILILILCSLIPTTLLIFVLIFDVGSLKISTSDACILKKGVFKLNLQISYVVTANSEARNQLNRASMYVIQVSKAENTGSLKKTESVQSVF